MKLKDNIIVILAVVIAITVGVFVGFKFAEGKNDNQTNNNQEVDNNGIITNSKDSNTKFAEFVKTFKKTRDKRENNNTVQIYSLYHSSSFPDYNTFRIEIDIEGNAVIQFTDNSFLNEKYPSGYKISEKVLYVQQVLYGNAGYYDLIFIKENGNPLVLQGDSLIESNEIIFKVAKNNNIIGAIDYNFFAENNGWADYYLVNIEGELEKIKY